MRNFHYISICALLALTVTTVKTHAQDYQPIYSNSLQVFYQEELFAQDENHNMWGTRIDSVDVIGGDTVFHNYEIIRDTVFEHQSFGSDGCSWWNAPNWSGYRTRIDSFQNAWFYNLSNDSILIRFGATIEEDWVAFEYPNGDFLRASVLQTLWVEDDWVSDSIKIIGFARYDDTTQISDAINDVTLELYKHNGIRKTVDFVRFPTHHLPIYRIDPNTINFNSPPYVHNGQHRWNPSVGDGLYRISGSENVGSSPVEHKTYFSKLITDVWHSGNGLQVEGYKSVKTLDVVYVNDPDSPLGYTYEWQWTEANTTQLFEHYTPNTDTVFETLIQDGSGNNLMPREKRAAYLFSDYYPTSCTKIVTISDCWPPLLNDPDPTDTCIAPIGFFKCLVGANESFMPYVGVVGSASWNYDWSTTLVSSRLTYLKVGEMVCGEYEMVGIESPAFKTHLAIFPNPANRSFKIESGVVFDQLSIYNLQGQLVWKSESQVLSYSVDCSQWPNGIYVIRSASEGELQHQKLIVSH